MDARPRTDAITADDLADLAELGATVDARTIKNTLPNYAPTSKAPKPGRHARKSYKKTALASRLVPRVLGAHTTAIKSGAKCRQPDRPSLRTP